MNSYQIELKVRRRIGEIKNNNLVDPIKELYEYIKSSWELDQVHSTIQARYELGYDCERFNSNICGITI